MKRIPIVPDTPAPSDGPQTPDPGSRPALSALVPDPDATARLRPRVEAVLHTIYDPEIPVDIYELGLIYDIVADVEARVGVRMTLTAPACPAAQTLPVEVERKVRDIPEVADAIVEVVWDPPWDRDRMSDAAKLQLGMF